MQKRVELSNLRAGVAGHHVGKRSRVVLAVPGDADLGGTAPGWEAHRSGSRSRSGGGSRGSRGRSGALSGRGRGGARRRRGSRGGRGRDRGGRPGDAAAIGTTLALVRDSLVNVGDLPVEMFMAHGKRVRGGVEGRREQRQRGNRHKVEHFQSGHGSDEQLKSVVEKRVW